MPGKNNACLKPDESCSGFVPVDVTSFTVEFSHCRAIRFFSSYFKLFYISLIKNYTFLDLNIAMAYQYFKMKVLKIC